MEIIHLKNENFKELIQDKVLVDFYAKVVEVNPMVTIDDIF